MRFFFDEGQRSQAFLNMPRMILCTFGQPGVPQATFFFRLCRGSLINPSCLEPLLEWSCLSFDFSLGFCLCFLGFPYFSSRFALFPKFLTLFPNFPGFWSLFPNFSRPPPPPPPSKLSYKSIGQYRLSYNSSVTDHFIFLTPMGSSPVMHQRDSTKFFISAD